MDVRAALTDDYLATWFEAGTLARARAYVGAVGSVEIVQLTGSALTATALVPGTAPLPYGVQLHLEVERDGEWLFSACTCPVARLCKHGAALALALREGHVGPARPVEEWRLRLERISREVEHRSAATLAGVPLALELSRRPASRWSRGTAGDFFLRPKRPGARNGWVKSGAEWSDVAQSAAGGRFVPAQADAVRALHRSLLGRHAYLPPGTTPEIDGFGADLVPLLRAALARGVELLPGPGVRSVSVESHPVAVRAHLARVDGGVRLQVVADDGARGWSGAQVVPVGRPAATLVLVEGDDVVLAEAQPHVSDAVADLLVGPPLDVPEQQSQSFLDVLAPLVRHLSVSSPDESVAVPSPPAPELHLTVAWRSSTTADLEWHWMYGGSRCRVGSVDVLGGLREPAAEQELLATVPAGLLAAGSLTGGDALVLALHDLAHLRSLPGVEVHEEDRPEFREAAAAPEITFDVSEQQPDHTDWLDLEVTVTVEDEQVPLPDVLAAITRGEEFLVLPSGVYVSLVRPELSRLHEVVAAAAELHDARPGDDRVRVSSQDVGTWAELAELGTVDARAAAWVDRAKALRDVTELPRPRPVGLATTLRPYQLEGFWWLAFLHQHGLGGILADDMGLGKTLQVLALVQHAVTRDPGGAPFLVVAPTSVVSAWRSEASRHAPALRVGVVGRRSDDVAATAARSDLVLTTYAMLRLEQEQLAALRWRGLVLDEAQQVKNHTSKAFAAARRLDADFRLAVTGTPFENRLMELWALLALTTPGLYPSPRRFRDVVVRPVEKQSDEVALRRFRTRVRPFLLRRTKELVAAELPPKQEQVLEVDLDPRHRRIYDTHLARERQRILGLVEDFDHNRVAILAALTRLRMLALDPALVDPEHDGIGSAKVSVLADLLVEITAEGHRALVFSQFTSFLGRVRDRLAEEGIPTTYLDGSTRDRGAVVEAFRRGDAPVFLISLKAGGTGLTLTEADYVFVLDPWWNPAAEAQAVDRAHRIGQDKHVHVYRLVATDTIEEKVMALKARKAALFATVFDGGAASAQGITVEDVRHLFDA